MALPTPPGVARRLCEIQKRGRPAGQRIVASRACSGRVVGSDETRWVARSAASFTEVANWLGTGDSPGYLSSWWLASQPSERGGQASSVRMYRGRLCSAFAAASSSACQRRSCSVVAAASGRAGIAAAPHRARTARVRRTVATSAPVSSRRGARVSALVMLCHSVWASIKPCPHPHGFCFQ